MTGPTGAHTRPRASDAQDRHVLDSCGLRLPTAIWNGWAGPSCARHRMTTDSGLKGIRPRCPARSTTVAGVLTTRCCIDTSPRRNASPGSGATASLRPVGCPRRPAAGGRRPATPRPAPRTGSGRARGLQRGERPSPRAPRRPPPDALRRRLNDTPASTGQLGDQALGTSSPHLGHTQPRSGSTGFRPHQTVHPVHPRFARTERVPTSARGVCGPLVDAVGSLCRRVEARVDRPVVSLSRAAWGRRATARLERHTVAVRPNLDRISGRGDTRAEQFLAIAPREADLTFLTSIDARTARDLARYGVRHTTVALRRASVGALYHALWATALPPTGRIAEISWSPWRCLMWSHVRSGSPPPHFSGR